MPLMGKKPQPTPQELYRVKKQREEEERSAFLPPGLINHGNTCFLNSTLQALIATPMLYDVVHFNLPDSYLPISPRRSPQLTNGHGHGGRWEQRRVDGMGLGDEFVTFIDKAWLIQDLREKKSMSPRDILARLGAKYDQYLDFRQQDAHELLRHLLDAMRMEELDIIKKRQPPQIKKSRSQTANPGNHGMAEEDQLTSFVDMVFGGRLASILVCEKCKKVSCTYEDFNDLSLSIKAEDYARERKRDRLKNLAKKFRVRGIDFSTTSVSQPRSSSVPASPTRRDSEVERSFEQVLGDVDQRRRSLDAGDEAATLVNEHEHRSDHAVHVEGTETPILESDASVPKGKGKQRAKDGGEEEEDGWVKLSRRISVGMGLKRGKRKGKSAEPSRERTVPEDEEGEQKKCISDVELSKSPDPTFATTHPPPLPHPLSSKPLFPRRPSPPRGYNSSPNISTSPSPLTTPALAPAESEKQIPRSSSPFVRSKSPRPPKPTKEEAAYLRRLLADVPSSSSSGAAAPFDTSATVRHAGFVWPKLGGVQSVEECLRMFTSVEVLDGENRVGCRRCWKIQNGEYVPRGRKGHRSLRYNKSIDAIVKEHESSGDDSSSSSERAADEVTVVHESNDHETHVPTTDTREQSLRTTTDSSSNSPDGSSLDLNEDISVESAVTSLASPPEKNIDVDSASQSTAELLPQSQRPACPDMSVPSISMTRPDSPPACDSSNTSTQVNFSPMEELRHPPYFNGEAVLSSPSFDSLQLPTTRHSRNPAVHDENGDSSGPNSDETDDELETETSMTASLRSDTSVGKPLPGAENLLTVRPNESGHSLNLRRRKSSRKKEVIFRRAYKRYLIAAPPPVLVIHLKRFQQVGKSPMQLQFFSNFKKLDDSVSFREYLDLSPFLMPKKEDYGLGGSGVGLGASSLDEKGEKYENGNKGSERCMYRLYAVVEHIGNMLGGHYVAYTALPYATTDSPSEKAGNEASPQPAEKSDAYEQTSRTSSFTKIADPSVSRGKSPSARKWCYISDTTVRLTTLEEVLKTKAYICMYERV